MLTCHSPLRTSVAFTGRAVELGKRGFLIDEFIGDEDEFVGAEEVTGRMVQVFNYRYIALIHS